MTESLTEETLSELAEALPLNNLLKLGLKLGFNEPKVRMYISTNKQNASFEGTSSMLFDWKRKTPKAKQIPDLIKALCDSGFAELVDEYLSSRGGNLKSAGDMADFDDILVTVAKRVRRNSEIDTLGRKLGFSPEDIGGYIATNHKTQNITWDGTLKMLRDWFQSRRVGTEQEGLKTALEKSGQIRLADELFPSNQ